jgi:phosphomannomutase
MARTGKAVSELVAGLPAYAIEKRKVDLARKEDAQPTIGMLAAAYKPHKLDTQDGIRIDFAHGPLANKAWLHVRASNTEPIMRLIAEAPTQHQATQILDEAAKIASP